MLHRGDHQLQIMEKYDIFRNRIIAIIAAAFYIVIIQFILWQNH